MRHPNARVRCATFVVGAVVGASALAPQRLAHAYTISSVISAGCHELITAKALRDVRLLQLTTAAPLPATANERALIGDLEFKPPDDMTDLGGATLLVGVRDNDLKGRSSNDLSQLALVHGDPNAQSEHCLRNLQQNEPDGSGAAVVDCRAFIVKRIGEALEGLDATGTPDLAKRTNLPIYLSLRHAVTASLPTFYVRVGQALHAIEDSFTHTYRSTPDGLKITTVLNWVDEANRTLVEATDGPPHSTELDRCDDPDDLRSLRHVLATKAVTAVLSATLDPTQTSAQKMAAVEVILDQYVSYAPGCTFDNKWCGAPEEALGNGPAAGCSAGDESRRPSGSGWTLLLALGVIGIARRRRHVMIGVVVAITGLFPLCAFAAPVAAEKHAPPAPVTTPVQEPGPKDPSQTAFGAYLGGSGSVNYEGLAAALGARLRVSKHWAFGLDAEWNPWIAVNGTTTIRAGAFNGYGTAIFRVPLFYEQFNLRTTASVGVSRLLIDLYGAPKGSTGLYVAFTPLGLEWKMSKLFFLIVNPLGIAIPTPQLTGVPFSYPQYRATIGIEFYRG